jgi:hypothetical protein
MGIINWHTVARDGRIGGGLNGSQAPQWTVLVEEEEKERRHFKNILQYLITVIYEVYNVKQRMIPLFRNWPCCN